MLGVVFQLGTPLRASFGARVTGDEPFYLLTTESLLADGDLDLVNQYEAGSYRRFFDGATALWTQSVPLPSGQLLSPHNLGLSLLVLPAYALGGLDGTKAFLAALGGITMASTYLLAQRLTGHRRLAWLATLATALSAPVFVYASQVYPEMPAALLVVLLGLLGMRTRRGIGSGLAAACLLGGLLWLGTKYAPLAGVLGLLTLARLDGGGRTALIAVSTMLAAHYAWFHVVTYGDLTPYAVNIVYAGLDTVQLVGHHVEVGDRLYRLLGLWVDREFGLMRWGPILLLALPGAILMGRQAGPARWWLAGPIAVQILVATFFAITMRGWWFPGRMLIVVLPLLIPLVTVALARLFTRRPLVAIATLLVGATISATVSLWQAARAGLVTLAVNPFDAGGPWLDGTAPLFPLYTAYTGETLTLSALWLALFGIVSVHAWRRATARPTSAARTHPPSPPLPMLGEGEGHPALP